MRIFYYIQAGKMFDHFHLQHIHYTYAVQIIGLQMGMVNNKDMIPYLSNCRIQITI